jgi:hypothetical protein
MTLKNNDSSENLLELFAEVQQIYFKTKDDFANMSQVEFERELFELDKHIECKIESLKRKK